ncbi:ATG1 [Candida oxycetoniae]|uniref:Serine/threonine-protein kinase ATG1 n=1 Tax=Candida oxycetoniae TaxID=497107 RepID=A0AAI9T1F8_9ASCO|nr:ATG1 [Candida oxycetoniae]KAI3406662.2 ATG1 [Candida oxycetoniae]
MSSPPHPHNNDHTSGKTNYAPSSQHSAMTTTKSTTSITSQKKTELIGIYLVGAEIGKGSFATVYKGYNTTNNTAVAIKSVNRSKLKSKKLIENLEIEISILKSMKHPHIVGLLDYKQTSAHFHLIMDYCSMGDLSYFIRRRNQLVKTHPVICSLLERYPSPEGSHGLNEVLVIHFLRQLSSALLFLRDKSLVHRDIKPQNLLLCPPVHSKEEFSSRHYKGMWELPILKIADFGFARFLPSTSMAETLCGSPLYMAPEILRYEKYNAKADLWSVGAVLYEMTVGKPPFKANNHIELLKNIEKANDKIKFPSAAQVPESLKQLIKSLLKYNPTERISFQEFFNDNLITCDLEETNAPLETSEMDENLFISEYISPIKRSDRSRFLNPLPRLTSPDQEGNDMLENEKEKEKEKEQQQQQQQNDTKQSTEASTLEASAVNTGKTSDSLNKHSVQKDSNASLINQQEGKLKDEEIKQLIHRSSPDPDNISHSINNSPILKIKRDDVLLEKDYVVVEKRAIEVNAIADELAHAGSGAEAINDPRNSPVISMKDNKSGKSQPTQQFRRTSSSGSSQRRPSFTERKISISISPTNALSKAIGLASHRLFGGSGGAATSNNQVVAEKQPSPVSFSEIVSSPNFANHALLQKLNLPVSTMAANNETSETGISSSSSTNLNAEEVVLFKLETIATKAHAVNLFADVKFSQLIPSPPSWEAANDDLSNNGDILPPKIVKTISEEGMVLYVKALSLLAKGMSVASAWWYNQFGNSVVESKDKVDIRTSQKINQLVQWIREKFNECLEKAEFVKLRFQEAKIAIAEIDGNEDFDENEMDEPRVVAEKLLFDRALEMSRNAAVNELVKEDLKGCELAYSTAIWMLEALLDEEDVDKKDTDRKLDDDDKVMVEKFIVSIGNRLSVLKRKIDLL